MPSAAAEQRDNWSGRFSRLQLKYDKRVRSALRDAARDVSDRIEGLEGRSGTGSQLRRAQLTGSRGVITRMLRDLYGDLEGIVEDGQSDAAVAAVNAMLVEEDEVLRRLVPDDLKRQVLKRSLRSQAEFGVQAMLQRVFHTERPLSESLYDSRAFAHKQLSRLVNGHLAQGSSAADIAKDVRRFVSPSAPGGTSYVAMRLGRTEIHNAFHAQSIADAQGQPWVDHMDWCLSKSHSARDEKDACEHYARQRSYPVDGVPPPPHPGCRCYVVPVVIDNDEFLDKLASGAYNGWLSRNDVL